MVRRREQKYSRRCALPALQHALSHFCTISRRLEPAALAMIGMKTAP
jgi:hypothetical protein